MARPAKATTEIPLTIDAMTYGPCGVGRREGKAVFVPLTAPGDEVDVKIIEERRSYSTGELLRIRRASPARRPAPCPYFGACGGCSWQHLAYESQLAAKAKSVGDALVRIGKLSGFELLPIVGSPRQGQYRRRIRLHSDAAGRTGFHRSSSGRIVEIDSCLIADPRVERELSAVREWKKALATAVEEIELSAGEDEGDLVFIGRTGGRFAPEDDETNARFLASHPRVSGLIVAGPGWRRSWGETRVSLYLEDGLKIRPEADAFTQVNPDAGRRLARELLAWGDFTDADRLLELYSGAGNFTLPMAKRCRALTAVEGNAVAVRSGRECGRAQGLERIRWIRAAVPEAVRDLLKEGASFSKIVLNPPRAGAKGLAERLALFRPEKIFYVSCNPATLARDLAALEGQGYRTERLLPVDFFPHTFHVEVLAEARRKKI
jgi:23S rRNA (uracil1939-C5)-methyltransferase